MKQQLTDKATYLRYRERARELYERSAVSHEPHHIHESIAVPLQAHVQICEGGAFVEAVVWVPEEKLATPCQHHYSDLGFCIDCGVKL